MKTANKHIINWRNCLFFFFVTTLGVIAAPIYVWKNGISGVEIGLFAFFAFTSALSITVGYHRLFAHRAFQASSIIQFLCLFFGAAAFQESLLQWASQHRNHHKYVDTEQDPYNIKQGFFYAHMGWLLFRHHHVDYENVRDLEQNKMACSQRKHYEFWAIGSGIVLPTLIGALLGYPLGGFLIGFAARMTFVHQGTFMINSVCHYFGKPTYDHETSPKDHWVVALITNGEGYHSFHHRFPSDYRNGVKWYHWDPSKWIIWLLSKVGLTSGLKRADEFQILSARIVSDRDYLGHSINLMPQTLRTVSEEKLTTQYQKIKEFLHLWEKRVREHAELCKQGIAKSHAMRKNAFLNAQNARKQFFEAQDRWMKFIDRFVLTPQFQY
jgi:stearoyl-CoA desaturase (Delta-9 desaturase)